MTIIPPGGQPMGPPPGPYQNLTPLPPNPQIFPSGSTEPWARTYDDPAVDLFVDTNEAQTGRLMLGVAVNSDAGLTGQILLDEQNFDWTRYPTSWDDVTSGRAFRGDGERFRLEAMPGTKVQRYVASFQQPYLWDTPVSLGLSGSYYDRQYKDWTEQRAGGRVSFGYNWTEDDVSTALTYRGEDVKIFDISRVPGFDKLNEMIGDNTLHGFRLSSANDTRDSSFLATSGHYLELSGEQVLGSFTYPRAMLDARQYWLLKERPDHSGRQVISYATQVGVTGANTPFYDNYFAGGFSTLRGYSFRGASPVEQNIQVGGEFMWVNSVEYLFPLTADDMMHGVVFTDFGTVEPSVEVKSRDFRVAPGFGLRITIPAMGPAPIALDFAFPIHSAPTDDKQVFSFNIGFNR
jgi:outer membrane protein insertion porin family